MNVTAELKHVSKLYGNVKAVDDVSFVLEPNKIYGLLGRNGAGKTTLMHMMTAQLFATSGELSVFGEQPYENERVLSQICFIKESQKYPDTFRVVDVLESAGTFFPNWDRDYAYLLAEDFRLPLKRRMKKLSRGMLSSVGIIVGLASRAPLTMFDEPYLGLDAVARAMFYDRLLEDYSVFPRTIVLSTHLIDEVSRLLEHVILVDKGKVLIDEDADTLRGKAFAVVGSASKVEAFLAGKTVIDKQPLGSLLSAAALGELSARERGNAAAEGLEVTPVSLQQLIVYTTNGKTERKAGNAR
ncbi:ABC transporter ATP-binding protein [Paenibacillus cymbidii]|uniref:ABC transporter ATP-binding protein n=1 Tax=Paenibacillus cymbidii TaxID=1639034 RepID=UPI0010804A32|nr:ABC transporter ATP-binding protein [Paenibacillus cymbidii]